jgi:hypothetical protein
MSQETSHYLGKMEQLRSALRQMERRHLPAAMKPHERDICYAVHRLVGGRAEASTSTEEIRRSPLCEEIPQATYNRAIRQLVETGFLARVPNSNGRYSLGESALVDNRSCCQSEDDHSERMGCLTVR